MGAKWDAEVKLWFVPAGHLVKHFEDFLPEAKENKLTANREIEDNTSSFYQSVAELGLLLPDAPVFNGRFQRVDVEGGRRGGKEGAYIGHDGAVPRGHVRNFKTGESKVWSSLDGGDWNKKEMALINLIHKQRALEAEKETRRVHEKNALLLKKEWDASKNADDRHPYLIKKQVGCYGLRLDTKGSLLMPLCDVNGTFSTMQRIGKDGFKQIGYRLSSEEKKKGLEFPTRKEGRFHIIGTNSLLNASRFVLVEGYATGATVYEALGIPVVVAVDAGNLASVALNIKNKHPEVSLLIAGDNDQKNGEDKNVGLKKAIEAATSCKGEYVIPVISKEEEKEISDWNDIAVKYGVKIVKEQIIKELNEKKNNRTVSEKNLLTSVNNHEQVSRIGI